MEPTFTQGVLSAFAQAFNCEVQLFTVSHAERAEPLWSIALFVRRRLGLTAVVRVPTLAYTPMALTAEGYRLLQRKPERFAPALRALSGAFAQIQLTLPPWFADVRPFQWAGWMTAPLYTALVDLTSSDLQAGWSASTRRTVRRHQVGYHFNPSHRSHNVVVALLEGSYARQARPLPTPTATLRSLLAVLAPMEAYALSALRSDTTGEIEASVAVLQNRSTAHYWLAGSHPGPAMSVLLDRLWAESRSRGLQTFDFTGANTPSIAEFKRRLGGRLVPYYHVAAHAHPLLRWRHRLSR